MKHLTSILIALAILTVADAKADTITFTLTSTTGTCVSGCSKTFTDSSNQLQAKIVSAYQSQCNVSINGLCTAAQVLGFFAVVLKNDLVNDITTSDKTTLENNSISGYVPINPQ